MMKVTGSSNTGHAVCCKPGYEGEHCNSNTDHICSQPVSAADTKFEFKNILTSATENHQLFAFCPRTSPVMCGIGTEVRDDIEGEMGLKAGLEAMTITADL